MSKIAKQHKQQARAAAQEKQAKRIVAGIAVGLIVAMALLVGSYYLVF